MKLALLIFALLLPLSVRAEDPEISIPDNAIALIKSADQVDVIGTNLGGGHEDFSVHNWKALKQFTDMLTGPRYIAVPKSLNPKFKSKARYDVKFFSHSQQVFEIQIIADTVLDLPNDPQFYMQASRHTDVILGPLLRLR